MDQVIFQLSDLTLLLREGRTFVQYDAGAHQIVMREDEITEQEAAQIQSGPEGMSEVLFTLQRRLIQAGIDPYSSNLPRQH